MTTIAEALQSPNVHAFLRAIRLGEGTLDADGYRRIVGGELFTSFADHPRKRVWIERYQVWSTAAGAYQFLAGTWDEMRAKYALRDFSPGEQDKAAIGLLIRRKALDDIIAGRIEDAIAKCRLEWASLPGSLYGQRTESMQRVLDTYIASGGSFAPAAPAPAEAVTELVEEAPPTPQQIAASPNSVSVEAEPMDPFTATAIAALVREIPGLIRSFGSDGRVTERNAKAAEILINSVQAATGTQNAQAAVEAVRASPEVRQQVTQRLEADGWFEITEAGGGGIEGARAYSTAMKGEDVRHIPAFWITLALLPLLYGTVWIVLTGSSDAFSGELRAAIASSVVTGILGGVIGYWLGLKFSAPRTQVLATGQQP
jgi:lysozyme